MSDFRKYFKQFGYDPKSTFCVFYGAKGEDLFGNFWEYPFIISYKCGNVTLQGTNVETIFQGAKYALNPQYASQFNNATAEHAFTLSRQFRQQNIPILPNWDTVKFNIMRDLLRIKFNYQEYKTVLLGTGNKCLVEHNPVKGRDTIWSDDNDGTGQNNLGKILMEIRQEFGGCGIVGVPQEYRQWLLTHSQSGNKSMMCTSCNQSPPNPGRKWCESCFRNGGTSHSLNQQMCTSCNRSPPNPGRKWCESCFRNGGTSHSLYQTNLGTGQTIQSNCKNCHTRSKISGHDFCGRSRANNYYSKYGRF